MKKILREVFMFILMLVLIPIMVFTSITGMWSATKSVWKLFMDYWRLTLDNIRFKLKLKRVKKKTKAVFLDIDGALAEHEKELENLKAS